MEFNLNQIVEQMIEKGYMTIIKGKVKTTGKLDREYIPSSSLTTIKKELALNTLQPVLTPEQLFQEFIRVLDMPTKTLNGRGGWYWINRFSGAGAKEFHRIVTKENIDLQILIASTKLYYIQTKECAKTISNYIVEGIWRSAYQEMLVSAEKGDIQQYIKEEIKGDSNTLDL